MTRELTSANDFVGQERALAAVELGLGFPLSKPQTQEIFAGARELIYRRVSVELPARWRRHFFYRLACCFLPFEDLPPAVGYIFLPRPAETDAFLWSRQRQSTESRSMEQRILPPDE